MKKKLTLVQEQRMLPQNAHLWQSVLDNVHVQNQVCLVPPNGSAAPTDSGPFAPLGASSAAATAPLRASSVVTTAPSDAGLSAPSGASPAAPSGAGPAAPSGAGPAAATVPLETGAVAAAAPSGAVPAGASLTFYKEYTVYNQKEIQFVVSGAGLEKFDRLDSRYPYFVAVTPVGNFLWNVNFYSRANRLLASKQDARAVQKEDLALQKSLEGLALREARKLGGAALTMEKPILERKDPQPAFEPDTGSTHESFAVGCYVVRKNENRTEVLVHVRGQNVTNSGLVSGPGGLGEGKNDNVTLQEEMKEEVMGGKNATLLWQLFDTTTRKDRNNKIYTYRYYVAKYNESVPILGPDSQNQGEVAEWNKLLKKPEIGNSRHAWLDVDEILHAPKNKKGVPNGIAPQFYGGVCKLREFLNKNPSFLK
jgi:hypothetical protein